MTDSCRRRRDLGRRLRKRLSRHFPADAPPTHVHGRGVTNPTLLHGANVGAGVTGRRARGRLPTPDGRGRPRPQDTQPPRSGERLRATRVLCSQRPRHRPPAERGDMALEDVWPYVHKPSRGAGMPPSRWMKAAPDPMTEGLPSRSPSADTPSQRAAKGSLSTAQGSPANPTTPSNKQKRERYPT